MAHWELMGLQGVEQLLADIELLQRVLERVGEEHTESDHLVAAVQAVLADRYSELDDIRHRA